MAEKVDMTADDFDRLKHQSGSRWADLMEKLRRGKSGEIFREVLPEHENNGTDRQRARQGIRSLARHHGMRVSVIVKGPEIFVHKLEVPS